MERPSQYLIDKCKSLEKTLIFFMSTTAGGGASGVQERRLTFLAQIDFWDWEMDEMIYAIESFQERSQAWEAGRDGVDQMLRANGLVVKKNKLWQGMGSRGWRKRWRTAVVAPVETANQTIKRWNDLLQLCVSLLQKGLQKYGVNAVDNLDKFKKKDIVIPELPQGDEDEDD